MLRAALFGFVAVSWKWHTAAHVSNSPDLFLIHLRSQVVHPSSRVGAWYHAPPHQQDQVIAVHRESWKNPVRTAGQWLATLRDHAFSRIGDKGVDQVTTADVMAVLLPIWTHKHATARKVRQRIGTIMK